ncbi:MAG TPA: hypothetical protein VHA70_10580 [Bauldia sp.]|nr:hypothetical protein [Bauldia sp.]
MADSPDTPTYTVRANAFVPTRTYRLTGDALTWQDDGRPLDGVFLDQIAEVRLAYAPTRVVTRRFRMRVILKAGGMVELFNQSYRGFADFEDQSAGYATFVAEFHRRLAAQGRDVRYRSGNTPAGYVANLFVALLTFAALAFVLLLFPIAALPGIIILKLAIIAAFIPTLLRYLRRARPLTYDPLAVPQEMLP